MERTITTAVVGEGWMKQVPLITPHELPVSVIQHDIQPAPPPAPSSLRTATIPFTMSTITAVLILRQAMGSNKCLHLLTWMSLA
jgi:hypothetical protein